MAEDEMRRLICFEGGPIQHKERGLCLDVEDINSGGDVTFTRCEEGKGSQQWTFDNYYQLH
ncbi:hypothetical protein ANCDUO_08540 [Ancylostoma duodenale]|uniref:Ricin B lectin domain-containing protein n=1 Tax=Ancylostoma duodenale TaxID=51022 RepID=A0A0C2DFF2_9BILA|nr:hypothetical protein ANCDUO_08540 [Ancylostoma duodenale]